MLTSFSESSKGDSSPSGLSSPNPECVLLVAVCGFRSDLDLYSRLETDQRVYFMGLFMKGLLPIPIFIVLFHTLTMYDMAGGLFFLTVVL